MPVIRLPVRWGLDAGRLTRGIFGWVGTAEGRRQRRVGVSLDGHRAYIEVRGAHRQDRPALLGDVRAALARLDGVDWVDVNAAVGRAVVVFDPASATADDFIATIEAVEDRHGTAEERFPHDRPDHPGDREPLQRNLFAIAADVVGVGVATGFQALRVVRIPAEIPGLISFADSQPRVRRLLENRLGRPAADVVLVSANALSQALGQGPIGLVVDIAHRVNVVGELQARRAVWDRRELEIAQNRDGPPDRTVADMPRLPMPRGPIERYADLAAVGSLGAMAITLGVTRNPRRAADLLLGGIPKAATLGREAFCAQLDRGLAAYGVIAMDPAVLRRLDRADTLVLDARVAFSDGWSIDEVVPFSRFGDPTDCAVRARRLFDTKNPTRVRTEGAWTLSPISDSGGLPRGARTRGRALGRSGRRVLGLWHGGEFEAFVAIVEEPVPLADELVNRAQSVGLEVFLAGGSGAFADRLHVSGRLPFGQLTDELQRLQATGRVPILVAAADFGALRVAHIGLGVEVPGLGVPWGADLLIGPGLLNAWRVVDVVPAARDVSRRSAMFAVGGASTGGLWAFMGPGRAAARRALLGVT